MTRLLSLGAPTGLVFATGCGSVPAGTGADTGPLIGSTSESPGYEWLTATLTIDGYPSASGWMTLREVETPGRKDGATWSGDGDGCVGGSELLTEPSGVFLFHPVFTGFQKGASSELLSPGWITWNANDPSSIGGEVTDQFRGTVTIAEWGGTRRVMRLDGEHCAAGELETCAPATGEVLIEGQPEEPLAVSADAAQVAAWRDVTTGELLCNSGW